MISSAIFTLINNRFLQLLLILKTVTCALMDDLTSVLELVLQSSAAVLQREK